MKKQNTKTELEESDGGNEQIKPIKEMPEGKQQLQNKCEIQCEMESVLN